MIDTELLPWKVRALSGNPKAILKIADAYWFGEGAPYDPITAGHFYSLLANYKEKLDYVDYAYLYVILGDVAAIKEEYSLAVEHYRTAFRLFNENYPKLEAEQRMTDMGFLNRYQEVVLKSSLSQ